MNSAHLLLRSETQAVHQKLEAHPLHRLLLSPNVNTQSLQQLLLAYLGFYIPLEVKLADFVPSLHAAYCFQSPCILSDLLALQTDVQKLLLCKDLPSIESSQDALGILYVLEGSRLGAKVINKHLQSVLPSVQIRFFTSKHHSLASHWANFVRLLEARMLTDLQRDTVVNKAMETYICFALWLDAINSADTVKT